MGKRNWNEINFWQYSFYHKCSSSACVWTFYILKSFQKISGKCVNIFQHWYTCCTVAHVFYVNMLSRGSSLKTDVKFNTCLTNKINVRFFVKCQLLFNVFCFWYYLRKKKKKTGLIILLWTKYTFDSGYKKKSRAPWKANWWNLFCRDFFAFFFFVLLFFSRCRVDRSSFHHYVLEKPNLSMWFKDEKLR